MRTALITEKGFIFEEIPIPEIDENSLLVKTVACGICEGDIFQYKSSLAKDGKPLRVQLGHEGSGIVVKTGKNVKDFSEGDRVTVQGGPYSEY